MRARQGMGVVALVACVVLSGCASSAAPGDASSGPGLDLPSVGSSTALTEHSVDGVTVALPAGWTATQGTGSGLQVSDTGGGATVTVVVNEVVRQTRGEISYDASSYLEIALPFLLKEPYGIDITESLTGRARTLTVPGAENAARLEVTGQRADEPVECSVVAAQAGPNMAVVIGTDVEAQLWEQIVASLRIDPDTLEPS